MAAPMTRAEARAALSRLGRDAARLQDEVLASRAPEDAHARFKEAWNARPLPGMKAVRRRRLSYAAWSFAGVGTVAAATALFVLKRPGTLSFRVADERGAVGAWIVADQESSGRPDVPLRFSDGTNITLEEGALGRVASVGSEGADIVVSRGRVHASVVHKAASAWRVSVGPFLVHVTGTEFDTAWDPNQRVFTLDLHRGSVFVTGCGLEPQAVHAGGALRFRCEDGRVVTEGAKSASTEEEAHEEAPPDAGAADAETVPSVASPPRVPLHAPAPAAPPPTDWRDLARSGAHAQALTAALPRFEAECEQADAVDLASLADAARFAGDEGHARRALLALRTRFPGTTQATTASFLLGTLAEGDGAFSEAADRFSAALTENPAGPLAREAEGRFIEATRRAGRLEDARRAAQHYLQRYPSGPHAALAIEVLQP